MEQITNLYENTEKTISEIAAEVTLPFSKVYSFIRENYSKEYQKTRKSKCYRNSKLGSKNPMLGKYLQDHPRYLGDVSDNKGYLMRVKPTWYTGRKNSVHVFTHHIVICEHLGMTEIPKGYCVHHIDHNPLNNSIENLQLLTLEEHTKLHAKERRKDADCQL